MVSNQLQSRPEFKGYDDGAGLVNRSTPAADRVPWPFREAGWPGFSRKGASPSQHGVSEGLDIVPGASPQADVVKGVRDATSA